MKPDPGLDVLEGILRDAGADERARIGAELRRRGFLLVWDQVDRAPAMTPVEEAMFVLGRLYPEMPEAHRVSLRRQLHADHDAGTWHGFTRPEH